MKNLLKYLMIALVLGFGLAACEPEEEVVAPAVPEVVEDEAIGDEAIEGEAIEGEVIEEEAP